MLEVKKHDHTLSATITMKSGTVYIANTARQATMAANQPSPRSHGRRGGVVGECEAMAAKTALFTPLAAVPAGWALP